MKNEMNMDARMETALKQDALRVSALPADIPASLRARITTTPAAPSTASVATTSTVAKLFTTKFMLASVGGMIAVAAAYFALTSNNVEVEQQTPSTQEPSIIALDTPKPVNDTITVKLNDRTARTKDQPAKQTPAITNDDLSRMLDTLQPSSRRMTQDDSIRASLQRKRR